MATITISISDETAHQFREYVQRKMGQRKGVLSKAVERALQQWIHEQKQRQIGQEMIDLMEQGIDMGGIKIRSRGELYDRR